MSGFIKIPGTWNGYEVNGKRIPGAGYATYRLRILLAEAGTRLAFKRYLAGFIVLFLASVNDILYSNLLIETGYMIQFGLFIFIFSQALLLSLRFSMAFATVEM